MLAQPVGRRGVRRPRPDDRRLHVHGPAAQRGIRRLTFHGLLTGEGGEICGIPFKVDVKSSIWYPIKAFEAAGYAVPTTWEELEALEAQIVADGNGSPWCLGDPRRAATGWIATDWLEDVMLRTAGIDAYNRWITHELPFDSPEVRAALDIIAEAWFTEGYVNGGSEAITATDRLRPMDPMFPPDGNWDGFTPGCWMHRQATWFGPDFFPDKRSRPGDRLAVRARRRHRPDVLPADRPRPGHPCPWLG